MVGKPVDESANKNKVKVRLLCLRQEGRGCGAGESPVYAGRVHGVQPHVQHLGSLGQLRPMRQGRISLKPSHTT